MPSTYDARDAALAARPQTCTVCRRADRVAWLLRKNDFDLYLCEDCNHIFVSPLPTDEQLARLYSFDSGYMRQEVSCFAERKHFPAKYGASLEQIGRYVPAGSLLDVGCSSGLFLYMARQKGYDVQGVELNEDTAAIARANDLPVFVGSLEQADFSAGSFNAVHLGDLIEHVSDPEALLRRVRELLRPQGVLLVVTPNHDAFFPRTTFRIHKTLGIMWSHPTPPLHLNQFSTGSLVRLLERSGFEIVEELHSPCSLPYELRATGEFAKLKAAVQSRRWLSAAGQAIWGAFVAKAYTLVWMLDRAALFKKRDFNARLVARRVDT